ncbi:hypothetical protein MMC28_008505 [Mycoblastus sanguinarius]|nr:hypothetical protein [Mycoblastus sanguinarius]
MEAPHFPKDPTPLLFDREHDTSFGRVMLYRLKRDGLSTHHDKMKGKIIDLAEGLSAQRIGEGSGLSEQKGSSSPKNVVEESQLVESDTDSDLCSDMESILSTCESIDSPVTSRMSESINILAADELTAMLLQHEELNAVYQVVMKNGRIGSDRSDRFERNLRHLLNQYAINLKKEATYKEEKAAVALVGSRSIYISSNIRRHVYTQRER